VKWPRPAFWSRHYDENKISSRAESKFSVHTPVGDDAMCVPQPVSAPLTRAAIFLVVTINPGPDNGAAVRSFCADLPALIRAVAPHSETRATVRAPPSCGVWRPPVALTSAAPITPSHEYYCSNNGKRPRNLQKLENNGLFAVAYSNVIILYRGVQTP
jgi:hypothetical protein